MSRKVSEKRLVDVLVSFLRDQFWVMREVRHYERSIDILALTHCSRELWAVEAKVNDWPRALQQATVNLAVADRSFIAIQKAFVHRVSESSLRNRGIGLISVGSRWGEVEVLMQPEQSPFVNMLAYQRVKDRIQSRVAP